MNDFCFSNYYKIMKENLINPSISDPNFMGELFSIVNVKHYYVAEVQKGSASRIINRSLDVPTAIREILSENNSSKVAINKNMSELIHKYYNESTYNILWMELKALLSKNKNLAANDLNDILNDNDFESFMTKVYFEAIRVPNKIVDVKREIARNGKTIINYDFNDIFEISKKKKKIIVIPVDTNFELKVESPEDSLYPLVDGNTLHGKWVNMMLSNGVTKKELNRMIKKGFVGQKGIGNISIVPYAENIYYLVSLSEFDNHNVARSNVDNMKLVLDKILEAYIFNGQNYELIIPLFGTGKSKIGLSHESSFYILRDYFVTNITKLSGKIRIVIYYEDMNCINI